MKRLALVLAVLLVASGAMAQVKISSEQAQEQVSHGQLAQLLLKVIATKEPPQLEPAVALAKAKQLDLVPTEWTVAGMLTQAQMADILHRLCPEARYQPSDPDAGLSQAFVEALLRRHLPCIESYLGNILGHGSSESGMMDEGVDRSVSPSGF